MLRPKRGTHGKNSDKFEIGNSLERVAKAKGLQSGKTGRTHGSITISSAEIRAWAGHDEHRKIAARCQCSLSAGTGVFVDGGEALPLGLEEKLLLDSYRAIPNKQVQESILTIATNATKSD